MSWVLKKFCEIMIKLDCWIAAIGVICADDFGGFISPIMTLVSVNKVAMPLVSKVWVFVEQLWLMLSKKIQKTGCSIRESTKK